MSEKNNKIRHVISVRNKTKKKLEQLKKELNCPSLDVLINWLIEN